MERVKYRPTSGPEDAAALIAVHERCAEADAPDPLSPLTLDISVDGYRARLSRIDPGDWVIAEREGQVIGYGLTIWDWPERDGTHVYPHMGYVLPAFRGQGIGAELVSRVEARCRDKAGPVGAERCEYHLYDEGRYEDVASPPQCANGYELAYTLWDMARDLVGVGDRRRGLARSLMYRGIAALHTRQVARIEIGTRYENPTAAWRLYEQVGFRKAGAFPRWRKPMVSR